MPTSAWILSRARCRAGVSGTRTIAFFPEGFTDVNVTIVITTPGADYTALGSFGNAAQFGENLVQSMDRSYELRNGRKPNQPVMVRAAV
jgi:PsbP